MGTYFEYNANPPRVARIGHFVTAAVKSDIVVIGIFLVACFVMLDGDGLHFIWVLIVFI
jgi:hypothetical protein